MTLLFYPTAGDWVQRVRLGPTGFSLTEAAESGTFAMSQVRVDDPAGELDIVGHKPFRAIETACSWGSLFRGWFADREVGREDSLLTGAARVWDCTVIDANGALQFEVIRGSDRKRPAETDTERLTWLLGSSHKGPILDDDTHVLGYDVDLDKADYTGMTMADVLADCASASGANYFATYDEDLDGYALHYYRPTRSHYSSTLSISNVLSDVDGVTAFAPSRDTKLQLDPSRVWSGVLLDYGERGSNVFEESATILAAIGRRRETHESSPAVRTAARASSKADRYLSEGETELQTIVTTLRKVPPSRVNLIRVGHRVQVKFTHLPGYTSWTWLRVIRRTVQQDGETQGYYAVTLQLSDPKQVGARVRHPARPVEPDVEDGASVSLARYCLMWRSGRDDGHGGIPDEFDFDGPGGPIADTVVSAVAYATPYIFAACPFGESGWSGVDHLEQWFGFDPGSLTDGEVGVQVSVTIDGVAGVAGARGLVFGVAYATPTAAGQFTEFGACGPFSDGDTITVMVPRSLLVPSTTQYLVVAPGWQAQAGVFACQGTLSGASPVVGGDFESGSVGLDPVTAVTRVLSGSGVTTWVSPEGDVDGSNRVFSLTDWNGKGVPRLAINGIELAYGDDYELDEDAGTVTLTTAPWAGADVRARYQT